MWPFHAFRVAIFGRWGASLVTLVGSEAEITRTQCATTTSFRKHWNGSGTFLPERYLYLSARYYYLRARALRVLGPRTKVSFGMTILSCIFAATERASRDTTPPPRGAEPYEFQSHIAQTLFPAFLQFHSFSFTRHNAAPLPLLSSGWLSPSSDGEGG